MVRARWKRTTMTTGPQPLLDSDVCIDLLRARSVWPMEEMRRIGLGAPAMTLITYGEVLTGILYSRDPVGARLQWLRFLAGIEIVGLTVPIVEVWAAVRGLMRRRGFTIGDNDLVNAATALYFGMTLVTRNVKDYENIPGIDLLVPDE
jgi:tRNA(fMet)-specific endonuclease VapC